MNSLTSLMVIAFGLVPSDCSGKSDLLQSRMAALLDRLSNAKAQDHMELQAIMQTMGELQWYAYASAKSAIGEFADFGDLMVSCGDQEAECDASGLSESFHEVAVLLTDGWDKQMEVGQMRDKMNELLFKGSGEIEGPSAMACGLMGALAGGSAGAVGTSIFGATSLTLFSTATLSMPPAFPLVMLGAIIAGSTTGGIGALQCNSLKDQSDDTKAKLGSMINLLKKQFEDGGEFRRTLQGVRSKFDTAMRIMKVRKDPGQYKMIANKVVKPVLKHAQELGLEIDTDRLEM